jgi:DNA polymerase III subunit gamma/tau
VSYLVLARKYRPQKFDDLLGQEHVARTLTNAIAMGRVHHAFLFTGARGIGKTSAARILAKALCCAQGPTANPCGTCAICQSIVNGQSVDVQEIDGASNTGVDDVRALREGVRYLPAEARKKVYIIDEVHMLSTSAFNALLKTLEEPPEHVVFIFATTEVHKIPATIMSRCQRYDFKLLSSHDLSGHLTRILGNEGIACDADAVRLVAREAAGSVRDALSLLDQVVAYVGQDKVTREKVAEVLGVADRRLLFQLADKVLARDVAATLRTIADALDRGVDLMQMSRTFLGFLHDLEIVAAVPDAEDLIDATPEEATETRALAGKAGKALVLSLFDRWARAVEDAGRSQTPRLVLEMALVDLCQAEPLLPLGDLLDRLEKLEGRLAAAGALPSRTPAPVPVSAPAPAPRPRAPSRQSAEAPAPAPAPAPSSPVAPLSPDTDVAEVWRRVRESFGHRPAMAAALDHAEVSGWESGTVTLQFAQKFALDQTTKFKSEVERSLSQITGAPTRVELKAASGQVLALVRSEVGREAEAAQIDQHQRETEARQHPMIRKAQELFGVAPKEIKTR